MKSFAEPIYVTRPLLPPLEAVQRRLARVWESGWLANNGLEHVELQRALRAYLGVPYLSLFTNGTIALLTAIRSFGLHGEVVTTPFTFAATPHVLGWNGLTPVFADIDPDRLTLSPASVESRITSRTSAILAVHVYGMPCDVERLQAVADRHGLRLIYDGAHAFGTRVNGRGIGTFGDATMFSFHATKLFHTAEGGALACGDEQRAREFDHLKNFGILGPEAVDVVGINGKMSELQAVIGLAVLDCLGDEIARRETLVRTYRRLLGPLPGITFTPELPGVEMVPQYCAVQIDEALFGTSRDGVFDMLRGYNVHARKYFYPLCSDFDCYRTLPSSAPDGLPVASRVARQALCLPLYGALPETAVEQIAEAIASVAARA